MAGRKKIALCLEYPLALRGGVSVLVETLLPGLRERYDLVLVSPDTAENLANHPVKPLLAGHITWEPPKVSRETSRRLANELAAQGVQLAHFHLGGVFGWGNRFPGRCPISHLDRLGIAACSTVHLVVHPLDGYCGAQKPLWFKLALFPIAWTSKLQVLGKLRREIAVSKHDAAKLRRWYWPQRGKFVQLYHSRLRAPAPASATGAREPFILNAGHIARRKGQPVLVKAFALIAARHPEWKLCLAGDFTEKTTVDEIRAFAAARGLTGRIELLGERPDALDLMRRAGIYVQPSLQEALGLALQEALFAGCPSIGTQAGGIPELIDHERTGLLVAPDDPEAMAAALEKMISDPALRERFGRLGAVSIVEKGMTADRMTANHVELYESILGQS